MDKQPGTGVLFFPGVRDPNAIHRPLEPLQQTVIHYFLNEECITEHGKMLFTRPNNRSFSARLSACL